jgi:hypothetical protein
MVPQAQQVSSPVVRATLFLELFLLQIFQLRF